MLVGTNHKLFVGLWGFLALAAPVAAQDEANSGNLWSFLGHYHPVVLHFPIGLILALFVYELLAWPMGDARRGDLGRWVMLGLGSITAVIAAVFGVFLSWTATYDEELLWEHQWMGIAVAVLITLAMLSRIWFNVSAKKAGLWGYRFLVAASALLIVPAGHHGGELTHGRGYLATDLPASLAFLKPLLAPQQPGAVPESAGSDYFAREILPILQNKCFECHSAEKQKGGLRMDTREGILSAGDTGNPCVVPEIPSASYMMELILLPPESEDVMPPAGKTPLEPEEIVALGQWIARGAPWGDYEPPEAPTPSTDAMDIDLTLTDSGSTAPVVKTYEIMTLFFEEPPERIAEATSTEPENPRERRQVMQTVFNNANMLAEAHNLLFSRDDEDYMSTPEWIALTVEGRNAAVDIAEYLKNRDWEFEELRARYVRLIDTCNKCHVHFETGTAEVLPWPSPEAPEANEAESDAAPEVQSEV